MAAFVTSLWQLSQGDAARAGGKGASLGEMMKTEIPVPPGFVVLTTAFEEFLHRTGLKEDITAVLNRVNHDDVASVDRASEEIRGMIMAEGMPREVAAAIRESFATLKTPFVAVRSSATAEDSGAAAWAGQLESYLNTTKGTLLDNVKKCWASLFTPRAIFYRFEKKLHGQDISVAVVVQKMVASESAGVAFSVHPVTQDNNQMIIEAGFGLGEAVVSGQVTPDSYVLEKQPRRIIDTHVAEKKRALVRRKSGGNEWINVPTAKSKKQVLSHGEILRLAEIIVTVERHYGFPVDVEWAKEKGKFYIVQSRPITTLTQNYQGARPERKEIVSGLNLSEWELEFQQRDAHPPLMADLWLRALRDRLAGEMKLSLPPPDYIFTGQDKGYIQSDHKKRILSSLLKAVRRRQYLRYVFHKTMAMMKTLDLTTDRIRKRLSSSSTSAHLLSEWGVLENALLHVIPWFYIPWYLSEENTLTDRVISRLEEYRDRVEQITDFNNAVGVLTFPTKDAEFQKEQKSFFGLVKLARGLNKFQDNPRFKTQAFLYLRRYAWMKTFIVLPIEPLTYTELVARVRDALKKKLLDEHVTWQIGKKKNEEIQYKLLRLFAKDVELRQSITDAQELGWLLTASVEQGLIATAKLLPFYKQLAHHLGVPYAHWVYLTSKEIRDGLQGKVDISKLNLRPRLTSYVAMMHHGDIQWTFGQPAKSLARRIDSGVGHIDEKLRGFSGQPAFPGKVTGTVSVALSPKESKKVRPGDVLVTSMTSPDYIQAMKIAAAIVTNEGGLLSHAAIVSRELGKPCIVGAKIATKLLKDGDLVEVDADRGVVRKIEQGQSNTTLTAGGVGAQKQRFAKTYTRNFSIIMQEAWFAANKENLIKSLDLKEYPFDPPYVYFMKDGVEEVWENMQANEWLLDQLVKKIRMDPKFFPTVYRRYFQQLRVMQSWWKKDIRDIRTLKILIQKVYEGVADFVILYGALMDKRVPTQYRRMAEAMRKKDVYFAECNAAIMRALAKIFPDLGYRVCYITREELGRKITKQKLEKRDRGFGLIPGRFQEATHFEDFIDRFPEYHFEVERAEQGSDTLKGQSAYQGRVVGRVRIVKRPDQAGMVKAGEIIVSPMTTPDFLPAMRRAAAFVTDEGGVTCHAAIVARELKKPCVIGTKFATQLLHDGDLVKMDADRGTVKQIERAPTTGPITLEQEFQRQSPISLFQIWLMGHTRAHQILGLADEPAKQVYGSFDNGLVTGFTPKGNIETMKGGTNRLGSQRIDSLIRDYIRRYDRLVKHPRLVLDADFMTDLASGFVIVFVAGDLPDAPSAKHAFRARQKTELFFPTIARLLEKRAAQRRYFALYTYGELVAKKRVAAHLLLERRRSMITSEGVKPTSGSGIEHYQAFSNPASIDVMIRHLSVWPEQVTLEVTLLDWPSGAYKNLPNWVKYVSTESKNKHEVYLYWDTRYELEFLKPIEKRLLEEPKYFHWLVGRFHAWYRQFERHTTRIYRHGQAYYEARTNAQLRKDFQQLVDVSRFSLGGYYIVYDVMNLLTRLVHREIERVFPSKSVEEIDQLYRDVSLVGITSVIQTERIIFLRRLRQYQLAKTSAARARIIRDQWFDFTWMVFNHTDNNEMTIEDYRQKFERNMRLNATKELAAIKKERRAESARARILLRGFKKSPVVLRHITWLRTMMEYRNHQSLYLHAHYAHAEPLLSSIAARLKIKDIDIWWLSRQEIDQGLRGKIDARPIARARAKKGFTIKQVGNDIKVFTGTNPEDIHDLAVMKGKELRGTIAYPGKVSGIARVISDPWREGKTLRVGDILVTSMTTPEFVPLLKRAAAVVTNEGGLLCHAAIVARELKKPCIIGTKIATRVLQSGQFIDVNADEGVVAVAAKKKPAGRGSRLPVGK